MEFFFKRYTLIFILLMLRWYKPLLSDDTYGGGRTLFYTVSTQIASYISQMAFTSGFWINYSFSIFQRMLLCCNIPDGLNLSGAEDGILLVNRLIIFHEEKSEPCASSQYWKTRQNTNMFLIFIHYDKGRKEFALRKIERKICIEL